ncbi:MAG: hypothetical protein KDE14_16540 [Rhodobacteraceae bacterium]|nr:hypothetical protein [Paracoccaceae bacterium]
MLLGAELVLTMHTGFAWMDSGTVHKTSKIDTLVKILDDFSAPAIALNCRLHLACRVTFFDSVRAISSCEGSDFALLGYGLIKSFFLSAFATAFPRCSPLR